MIPYIARHLVYPLQEHLMQRPTFRLLQELEESQWYNRDAIEHLQMQKLADLLKIALEHSPWHAKRLRASGFDMIPKDIELRYDDLRRIPTMRREDAQLHREELVWKDVPGGAYPYNTGGSSGKPLKFYFGRQRQAADAANRMRARRWWGVDVGEREVYLWGAPVELSRTDRIKTIRDSMVNHLLLNAFQMSRANMDAYLKAIRKYDPVCIYSYASSIALLADHAKSSGNIPLLPALKVVCTTGEPLYPHQRELISEVFGVPVCSEYGSRDCGLIGYETPGGQMLQMSESILVEVLDERGQPVEPGQTGEAVITGLYSDAQPFLRYRTGDMLALGDDNCREGRGLHVIENVSGRTTDFIVAADGTIMHALAVIYILRDIEGVAEFKVVQHAYDEIEVQIVVNKLWHPECKGTIEKEFHDRLGRDVRVEIVETDCISSEASGKHRYVVSKVSA